MELNLFTIFKKLQIGQRNQEKQQVNICDDIEKKREERVKKSGEYRKQRCILLVKNKNGILKALLYQSSYIV